MAVAVRAALWRALRRQETAVWRVSSDHPDQLGPILRAALHELGEIDEGWQSVPGLQPGDRVGPAYVGDPVPVPGGWLLLVDFGSHSPSTRRRAVERLVQRLTERLAGSGIGDVDLGPAPTIGNRYTTVFGFSPMARALLFGLRPGPGPGQPPALVDLCLSWLGGRLQPGSELLALVISAELPVDWPALRPVADAVLQSGQEVTALSTDFATSQSSVTFGGWDRAGTALSTSGAGLSPAQLAGEMRAQRDLIRSGVAVLRWAGVTVETDGQYLIVAPREASSPDPSPMWFQVLTTEHLRLLGGPPPGSVVLDDGRAELTIGEPEQWISGHPDQPAVYARARALLTPRL